MSAILQRNRSLLLTTAICGCLMPFTMANAQTQTPAAGSVLDEVVVTATRQTDTVNKVSLAITAATQKTMDQKGVRTLADLQTQIPSVQINQIAPGIANVAIRGIANNGGGSATTGFYLDDTPIQKRGVSAVTTNNGAPLPPLFDLDRVEVLRGPQGTLYGGSSQGGTIRYITPTPSLTRYSTYARASVESQAGGDNNYEGGVAMGGPIIEDKLGFRASVWARKTGGYVDYVNVYDPNKVAYKNANSGKSSLMRASLLWAPTENLRIMPALLLSHTEFDTATSTYNLATTTPIVEPTQCFNTNSTPNAGNHYAPIACSSPLANFTRPGYTYGPFSTLGEDKLLNTGGLNGSKTNVRIGSLTADYDFGPFSAKLISSYINDSTTARQGSPALLSSRTSNATFGSILIPSGLAFYGGLRQEPSIQAFWTQNVRYGASNEVRLSSNGPGRLTWVAGLFHSNMRIRGSYQYYNGFPEETVALYGSNVTLAQRFVNSGTVPYLAPNGQLNGFDFKYQNLKDTEIAGFGEVNFMITEKLKATAGLRLSKVSFDFAQILYGPGNSIGTPTVANGGFQASSVTEKPVTPKVALTYSITDRDLVYVQAAKGYRAGGVNTLLPPAICFNFFNNFNVTQADIPKSYDSDSVWSYELGGKARLFNKVQVNTALFRVDWKNIQTSVTAGGCGTPFTANAGNARSQGVEIEVQAQLFEGLSVDGSFAYTDAENLETADALKGKGRNPVIVAYAGTKLNTPPITVNLGARYNLPFGDSLRPYVRVDYRYNRAVKGIQAQTFGLPGFAPDAQYPNTSTVNARFGLERGAYDLNLFATNLFNTREGNITGGRGNCALTGTAACTSFTSYTPVFSVNPAFSPRVIGLQLAYRH